MSMQNPQTLAEQMRQLPFSPELAAALIADLCRTDRQFADQMRTNPLGCIRKALADHGQDALPEGFKVRVHENRDDIWHLPLPRAGLEQHLLAEEQLENISGGIVVSSTLLLVGIASAIGISLLVGAGVGTGIGAAEAKKRN